MIYIKQTSFVFVLFFVSTFLTSCTTSKNFEDLDANNAMFFGKVKIDVVDDTNGVYTSNDITNICSIDSKMIKLKKGTLFIKTKGLD